MLKPASPTWKRSKGDIDKSWLYLPKKPYLAANFNTNCLLRSSPAGLPNGTYHSPLKRHLWYSNNSYGSTAVQTGDFIKRYRVGEQVSLPFLNWKLQIKDNPGFYKGNEYFVQFNDFDGTVARYRGINVEGDKGSGSLLTLSMQGTNKARMVEYLNSTVKMLIKIQLDGKNQFATNTIRFIDSTLVAMESQLKQTGNELKTFRKDKNIFEIEDGGSKVSDKIMNFDVEKDQVSRKISYYNSLKTYLNNSVDYSRLPAPSVAGIEDPNIVASVSKLIALSTQRSEMAYAVKSEKIFQDFDNQMEAIKNETTSILF